MSDLLSKKFETYPKNAKSMLRRLQRLIVQAGKDYQVGPLEESLKWGELSYQAKGGCAVRIDWKPKFPDKCFIYFQCQTRLVETFNEIYGDLFQYEGKRAIVLDLSRKLPSGELKHCISLSFRYHKLKHLPLLGV